MRQFLLALALLAWVPSIWNPAWGQTPGVGKNQTEKPKQNTSNARPSPDNDQRGTEAFPLVIETHDRPKTYQETAKAIADEYHHNFIERWTLFFTGAGLFFSALLVFIGWRGVRAANRTLREINRQANLMEQQLTDSRATTAQQAADVQASIAEATRSARAMEGIADSMAFNVESVRQSVAITREIADRQQLITELQSRAYLVVIFEGMVPQDKASGVRFEPRLQIVNRGNTPAYKIRFSINADVVAFPIPPHFSFVLPTQETGYSSAIGPGMHKIIGAVVPRMYEEPDKAQICVGVPQRVIAWGIIRYEDAFKIERFLRFGFTFYLLGKDQWMSMDTTEHNESD